MAKHKTAKDRVPTKAPDDPVEALLCHLGLRPEEWPVDIDLRKGMLTNQRGAVVHVRNLRTGKSRRESRAAKSKNGVRRAALDLARELIMDLADR